MSPSEVPLDEEEYRRWRGEADRALISAQLQADSQLDNWACFAAEQAAQLAVKGLLHSIGKAPWGHDLIKLAETLDEVDLKRPTNVHQALVRLSRHYIPSQYPDAYASGQPGEHYSESDARQAIEDAKLVVSFCDEKWEMLSSPNA